MIELRPFASLALVAALAACTVEPVAPTVAPSPVAAKPGARTTATAESGSGVQVDDPSGLNSGRVGALKPPPPPPDAATQASAQLLGQDVAVALVAGRELDSYALTLDKGNAIVAQGAGNIVAQGAGNIVAQGAGNIVAQGAGNIVAQGAGNYMLFGLVDDLEKTLEDRNKMIDDLLNDGEEEEPKPTPPPAPEATSAPPPAPSKPPAPLVPGKEPALAPKYKPSLNALLDAGLRDRVIAQSEREQRQQLVHLAKLPERAVLQSAVKAAAWAANGDGTLSKDAQVSMEKQVGGKTVKAHATMKATVDDASDTMVHHVARLVSATDLASRSARREMVLTENGSRFTAYQVEEIDKQGNTRRIEWTRTVDLDNNLKGKGALTLLDPSGKVLRSANIELSGTAAAPVIRVADANSKLEANLRAGTDATFKLDVRSTGTSAAELTLSGDTAPGATLDNAATP